MSGLGLEEAGRGAVARTPLPAPAAYLLTPPLPSDRSPDHLPPTPPPLFPPGRKKEHTQRLQAEIAGLQAENVALEGLLSAMTATGVPWFGGGGAVVVCIARHGLGGWACGCVWEQASRQRLQLPTHPTSEQLTAPPPGPPCPTRRCCRPVPAARGQQRGHRRVAEAQPPSVCCCGRRPALMHVWRYRRTPRPLCPAPLLLSPFFSSICPFPVHPRVNTNATVFSLP